MTGPQLLHDELEELITADALDGLAEDERRFLLEELGRHGPQCVECQRLIVDYSEVAGLIATTLDPAPLSGDAEERLLAAARTEAMEEPQAPAAVASLPATRARPRGVPGRARRWIAAAAVAVSVAAVSGLVGYELASAPPAAPAQFAAFAAQEGTRLINLSAPVGQRIAVAVHPGQPQGWVVGSNLPGPPGNKVYELWFLPSGSKTVKPAGTFVPTDGTVLSPATLGSSFTALAVSVEPPGGSQAPTTVPVYQASVTP